MSRKDYKLIANNLRMLVEASKVKEPITNIQYDFIVNQTINKFVRDLQEDNPNFSPDKFLEAVNA